MAAGSVAAIIYDENIDPAGLPESEAADGGYVLLSEEDLEELFIDKEAKIP
jgi:hypothetical protein